MTTIVHSSRFHVPPDELFAFHLDAQNLAAISPPLPRFEMLSDPGPTEKGALQEFRLSMGPLRTDWKARIVAVQEEPREGTGVRFLEDIQESGPFREWRHQHQVRPAESGAELRDVVRFQLFPTRAGRLIDAVLVAPGIKLLFVYRHWQTRRLLRG